jgi:hypothetical protein
LASCPVVSSGPDVLKNSSFALDTVIFPLGFGLSEIRERSSGVDYRVNAWPENLGNNAPVLARIYYIFDAI